MYCIVNKAFDHVLVETRIADNGSWLEPEPIASDFSNATVWDLDEVVEVMRDIQRVNYYGLEMSPFGEDAWMVVKRTFLPQLVSESAATPTDSSLLKA